MDPNPTIDQIAFDFPQSFRIYKNGRIERFSGTEIIPPSTDPQTGVQSKDILISPESGLSARIFLPRITKPTRKLPILLFIHGGAFCVQSPYSPRYHSHVSALAAEASVVALSVDYRKAPEHPLPIAYDDAWEAAQWAAAHYGGDGPEAWLNDHADLGRVFVAGVSAGANIAHYVVRQAGVHGLDRVKIVGLVAFHPFFGNDKPDKLLEIIFQTQGGPGDPRLYPGSDPRLASLGCAKVLVLVAEKDFLKDRGWGYYEALKKSGWSGKLEIVETEGEDHVFHLLNPTCDEAVALMNKRLESLLGVSFGGSVIDSMILIVTTSVEVVFGVLVLVWRRSSDRSKEVKHLVVPLRMKRMRLKLALVRSRSLSSMVLRLVPLRALLRILYL